MKVTMNLVKCADEKPPKNGRYIVVDMLRGGTSYFGEDATVDEELKTGEWNKRAAKPQWIPVTERYPEEKQFFRVDGTEDYDPSPRVLVQLNGHGYMKVSRYWSHSQVDNTHPWLDLDEWDSDHVVAWMPLPEAYKEGEI